MASSKHPRARDSYARDDHEDLRALPAATRSANDDNDDGFAGEASHLGHRSQGRNQLQQLDVFYDQSLITEVQGIIKIGKEASAYRCRAGEALGGGLVVAKVYRDRQYRFKNDSVYQEGRDRMLSGRVRRALSKKTGFGQEAQTGLWVSHEWQTLNQLYAAGVSVPKPLAIAEDAVLMQYFGDEDEAAPQLNRPRLSLEDAQRVFDHLLHDIETMLACDVVHGDLSPHNILYWQEQPVIIDLPQAVDPRFNSRARDLFQRDIDNVCRYFALQGLELDAWAIANEMWTKYELGEL